MGYLALSQFRLLIRAGRYPGHVQPRLHYVISGKYTFASWAGSMPWPLLSAMRSWHALLQTASTRQSPKGEGTHEKPIPRVGCPRCHREGAGQPIEPLLTGKLPAYTRPPVKSARRTRHHAPPPHPTTGEPAPAHPRPPPHPHRIHEPTHPDMTFA